MGIKTKFPNLTSIYPSPDESKVLQRWMDELRENGIQVESHIRLFVFEFVKYVGEDLSFVVRRFAKNKIKQVNEWLDIEKDKAIAITKDEERANEEALAIIKSDLFKFISHLNDSDALICLLSIISRCKEDDPQAYSELNLNNLISTQYYSQLYSIEDQFKVDRIRSVLEPKHIIKWFKFKGSCEYEDLIKRVERLYIPENQAKRETEAAACLFIRGLVHCSDIENSTLELGDWYYEFIEALLSHGDCRFFARLIDSNYIDSLDKWKAKKLVTAGLVKPELFEYLIGDEEEITSSRDQIDYLNNRITSIESYSPEEYDLRPYQNELVLHANNGRNTIICAPTGSGKTLVAVDIIKNHLVNRHRLGKVGRCVMLVPTVPLVDQQTLHFVQFLMDLKNNYRPNIAYWVDGFSGCENIPEGRADRLLASDIVVMTPQILINMLESILRSERIYFADFTLIIFDECHHATKQHPYKLLMEMLENSNLTEKPQIVGLTASMGVGDTSLDIKACYEHMLTLCSNLHSDTISTVRHQLDNLKSHVMPPVDYVKRVKRPKEDPFLDYIERVMFQIEKNMKNYLPKLAELCKLKKEEIEFPLHSNNSRYQTIVGTLKKCAQRVQDSEMRFLLVRSIDHLSHYFHAILINDLLPSCYAFKYLQEKMKDYLNNSDGSSGPIDLINKTLLDYYSAIKEKLAECVKNEKIQNKEILKELHSILRKQFETDSNSRCLIFVSTRNSASKLADHLKSVPQLDIFYKKENVGFMVSSNQSLSAGGQSTIEQQNMIKDFDSGKIKVLVVTSVAEEGVNIAACNLIIKYNNVGSERSMIQRRGRARQKNSVSILLALDTSIEQAEYINMQKEAMMMKCLIDLQEKSETILKNQINAKREERRKIEERKLTVLEARRSRLNSRRYKLSCRSCNNLICKSIHVRSIAHTTFVVCDPTVWQRSKIDIREKPTKDHLFTKCAKWLCGQCGNQEWGVIVKYSNCFLPQLTANLFSLEREDQLDQLDGGRENSRAKTWNNIQEDYFNITPINMRNIVDMFSALTTSFSNLTKQMDQQECIANLKYIEKMKERKNDKKNKMQIFLEE